MDINTILKTINGMAEKIEVLEDKLKNRCDYIDKHNRVHFDAMAKKIESLTNFDEKTINCLEIIDERIHHLKSDIKELAKNDIDLDNKINTIDRLCIKHYDDLEAKNYQIKSDLNKRCDDLWILYGDFELWRDKSQSSTRALLHKIDDLNNRCTTLAKVDNNIIECMDDLEVKNYQIKRDVDDLKYYRICNDELTKNGETNE